MRETNPSGSVVVVAADFTWDGSKLAIVGDIEALSGSGTFGTTLDVTGLATLGSVSSSTYTATGDMVFSPSGSQALDLGATIVTIDRNLVVNKPGVQEGTTAQFTNGFGTTRIGTEGTTGPYNYITGRNSADNGYQIIGLHATSTTGVPDLYVDVSGDGKSRKSFFVGGGIDVQTISTFHDDVNIEQNLDVTGSGTFEGGNIAELVGGAPWVRFGHEDQNSVTSGGFMQHSDGSLRAVFPTGKNLRIRENNDTSKQVEFSGGNMVATGSGTFGDQILINGADGTNGALLDIYQTTDNNIVRFKTSGGGGFNIEVNDYTTANPEWWFNSNTIEDIVFGQASVEKVRINSTGLGVTGSVTTEARVIIDGTGSDGLAAGPNTYYQDTGNAFYAIQQLNGSGGLDYWMYDGGWFKRYTFKKDGTLNLPNLPTSASGLSAGDIWNNSGVINIV
jgi:hypothetical protein